MAIVVTYTCDLCSHSEEQAAPLPSAVSRLATFHEVGVDSGLHHQLSITKILLCDQCRSEWHSVQHVILEATVEACSVEFLKAQIAAKGAVVALGEEATQAEVSADLAPDVPF